MYNTSQQRELWELLPSSQHCIICSVNRINGGTENAKSLFCWFYWFQLGFHFGFVGLFFLHLCIVHCDISYSLVSFSAHVLLTCFLCTITQTERMIHHMEDVVLFHDSMKQVGTRTICVSSCVKENTGKMWWREEIDKEGRKENGDGCIRRWSIYRGGLTEGTKEVRGSFLLLSINLFIQPPYLEKKRPTTVSAKTGSLVHYIYLCHFGVQISPY